MKDELFVGMALQATPFTDSCLQEIRLAQNKDGKSQTLKEEILHDFKEGSAFWPYRGHLTYQQGLIIGQTKSVWWPHILQDSKMLVEGCEQCLQSRAQHKGALITTPLQERPWILVGIDIMQGFEDGGSDEMAAERLYQAWHFKTVCCDGRRQFTSWEFQLFAQDYWFSHITSSPRFPQSNGAEESTVSITNKILMNS
ncbi:hypothetical protein PR048_017513 [Dryococelus australis]|uniref:Integrase catalytic domain-containing protein n=1 Tax=Dryococelus australis TaxID=614101 RepID=A0ABQ9H9P8_9NEOP|nr:hypothetical protein PR048_017513 [Dryococelus australis]